MTTNDVVVTEQLINIPIQASMCSAELRGGNLDQALKHAEAIKNRAAALSMQLKNLGAKEE